MNKYSGYFFIKTKLQMWIRVVIISVDIAHELRERGSLLNKRNSFGDKTPLETLHLVKKHLNKNYSWEIGEELAEVRIEFRGDRLKIKALHQTMLNFFMYLYSVTILFWSRFHSGLDERGGGNPEPDKKKE